VTDTLFPDLADPEPPAPVERLSTDRRTLRQHAGLAAGRHPLTRGPVRQPAGETCGSYAYREMRNRGNRSYPKCVYLDDCTTRVAVVDQWMCCEWTVALGQAPAAVLYAVLSAAADTGHATATSTSPARTGRNHP
jgi:hypothetical protein